MFIAIEGNDGSGKTTLINSLKDFPGFEDKVFTREPGGTELGAKIRELILNPVHGEKSAEVEFLLFMADRLHHVETLITPALAAGKTVITDRFLDSTYAYQVVGCQMPEYKFNAVVNAMLGDFKPDKVICLLCPPEIAVERLQNRSGDRFDSETIKFHYDVYEALKTRAYENPDRYHLIDGSQTPQQVMLDVIATISSFFLPDEKQKFNQEIIEPSLAEELLKRTVDGLENPIAVWNAMLRHKVDNQGLRAIDGYRFVDIHPSLSRKVIADKQGIALEPMKKNCEVDEFIFHYASANKCPVDKMARILVLREMRSLLHSPKELQFNDSMRKDKVTSPYEV